MTTSATYYHLMMVMMMMLGIVKMSMMLKQILMDFDIFFLLDIFKDGNALDISWVTFVLKVRQMTTTFKKLKKSCQF